MISSIFLFDVYQDSESDDEESDDEEEDASGSSDFKQHYDEDADFPNTYKEIKKLVKSLRVDAIISSGLNIARK